MDNWLKRKSPNEPPPPKSKDVTAVCKEVKVIDLVVKKKKVAFAPTASYCLIPSIPTMTILPPNSTHLILPSRNVPKKIPSGNRILSMNCNEILPIQKKEIEKDRVREKENLNLNFTNDMQKNVPRVVHDDDDADDRNCHEKKHIKSGILGRIPDQNKDKEVTVDMTLSDRNENKNGNENCNRNEKGDGNGDGNMHINAQDEVKIASREEILTLEKGIGARNDSGKRKKVNNDTDTDYTNYSAAQLMKIIDANTNKFRLDNDIKKSKIGLIMQQSEHVRLHSTTLQDYRRNIDQTLDLTPNQTSEQTLDQTLDLTLHPTLDRTLDLTLDINPDTDGDLGLDLESKIEKGNLLIFDDGIEIEIIDEDNSQLSFSAIKTSDSTTTANTSSSSSSSSSSTTTSTEISSISHYEKLIALRQQTLEGYVLAGLKGTNSIYHSNLPPSVSHPNMVGGPRSVLTYQYIEVCAL